MIGLRYWVYCVLFYFSNLSAEAEKNTEGLQAYLDKTEDIRQTLIDYSQNKTNSVAAKAAFLARKGSESPS